jgi:DHA1 family bicyclomycin/chloramphenicol resistance-like MFS transporter
MLAPTIGGYVTAAYGWHVVLILMGIGIVVLLASHFGFTYTEPDTSISLKPKPIILNFERDERTSVLYLCFTGHFLWVIHVRRGLPYSFMDVLKLMPQRTDGFCLYVFEFY